MDKTLELLELCVDSALRSVEFWEAQVGRQRANLEKAERALAEANEHFEKMREIESAHRIRVSLGGDFR